MINYLIMFLAVIGINVIPFLMPPTWLVLAFFYHNYAFNILLLAAVGAIASTLGRIILSYIGTFSRKAMNKKRQKDMDFVGTAARTHPVKSFFVTFLFSLSPFPSNVYFLGVGMAKARSAAVFAGFFIGRLISYYVMMLTSAIFFTKLEEIFASKLTQIIVIDAIGIIFMAIFLIIDWKTLIKEKRLKFIRPSFRKP
jgi:membrane protein YqaA with SNARE-associated domain